LGEVTAFLLDTSALIDFSKRWEPARTQILAWVDARETLASCAISIAEFYSGLPAPEREIWDEFTASLAYWPISIDAAMRAGQDRYRYARQGKAIAMTDALIAAVAREHHAILVTRNVKHFPMDDLMLFPLDE
jgi:predicted nucleic acid-binding protein